jgi:hypothetical protein
MATGGLYGQSSAGIVSPQSGSESSGLYGNNTVFGGTYFEWFIFQVSDTQPATPTGGSWSFTTNINTPPTGWLSSPPASPTNTVWVSIGLVSSRSNIAITWSTPGKFAFSSGLPIISGASTPLPGDGVTDQLYIETGTTPETIWFKQAGTWTRLTGSNLYMDLVNNQTVGGQKTFSSQIIGSVSGNAANVTGVVAVANGGTGAASQASAINNLIPSQAGQSGKYLTTDGSNVSWATVSAGGGTVTSVGMTVPAFLSVTGSPVTSSGTLAVSLSGTALPVANGGTGATSSSGARSNIGAYGMGDSPSFNIITASGEITAYFSDERLKTKLGNIENALDKVCSLNGFYYEPNDAAQSLGYKKKKEVGLSAQEVEKVLPEIIAPAPIDNQYMTIHYEKVVPLLVEAIKELRQEIAKLKEEK